MMWGIKFTSHVHYRALVMINGDYDTVSYIEGHNKNYLMDREALYCLNHFT